MKIVLDMNLSPSWISYLGTHGHEVKHWSDIGNICAPDREIMEWARDNEYIFLPMIWISVRSYLLQMQLLQVLFKYELRISDLKVWEQVFCLLFKRQNRIYKKVP